MLLRAGARVGVQNDVGITPLQLAESFLNSNGYQPDLQDIIEWLELVKRIEG